MTPAKCCVLILIATVAAGALRLPRLAQRPMHCDEAVQAYKFGELLEQNRYEYDQREYHGPTLEYLTLLPARLSRAGSFIDLNEVHLRVVPLAFGLLLLLGLPLLGRGLGWVPAVFAAVLTAVSPAMVFYSRYYIHEMLLVCFSFGLITCSYRYVQDRKVAWAATAGACAGLMHATKETCIIAFASMAAAALVLLFLRRQGRHPVKLVLEIVRPGHLAVAAGAALLFSVLFYSSFFSHPAGVLDSIRTYGVYLDRAGHNPVHIHPWHFYLGLLSFYQYADGPVYSEALLLILALAGMVAALRGKCVPGANPNLLRFLALYTLFMTLAYALIPYKTPWCLLGFLQGMILLAGVGAVYVIQMRPRFLGLSLAALLAAGTLHLAFQSYTANFKYYADSRNPYVYAHTSTDIFKIVDRVKAMAAVHQAGSQMRVQIICPNADYWPFPWYLRGYRAEYTSHVPENIPPAPVILTQPALEPVLMRVLYELPPPGQKELYMHLFYESGRTLPMQLRPGVELLGFVAKSLWDQYLDRDLAPASVPAPAQAPVGTQTNNLNQPQPASRPI